MQKIIKIGSIVLVIAAIIGLIVFLFLYVRPNHLIKANRNNINITQKCETENVDKIHFLSTDSSDCILIESGGQFGLVDCGEDTDNPRNFPELEYEGQEQKILDYLKANAVGDDGKVHLAFVLGTHSHSDHIGGFDTIINDDDVEIVQAFLKEYDETKITDHEVNDWDNKEVYEQMVEALHKKRIPINSHIENTSFRMGNLDITLYNTEYDESGEKVGENDNSMGVLIQKADTKIFLAGDIDNKSGDEDRIAKEIGKINILKVGHHSYSGSTTSNWLKTLKPETCIVTNAEEKVDKRTLRRIERIANSTILITGAENGVIVDLDNNGHYQIYNNIH